MLIRIYIAPQIGDGSDATPYTSLLSKLINVHIGEKYDEIDHPARRYSICTVTAEQATHDAIIADSRIIPVTPRLATDAADLKAILDAPFSSYPSAWRAAAKAKLEANGISTAWISGSNTLRDVLRYLLRMHYFSQIADVEINANVKTFLTKNLDATVGSLSSQVRNSAKTWMQNKGLAIGWITNTTTVREVVHFVVSNLGFGKIRFANGEEF